MEDNKIVQNETKIKKLQTMFQKANEFNRTRFEAYRTNMAYYQGSQKEIETKKPYELTMDTPYAAQNIDTRVASLIASDYIGELTPLNEESIDAVASLENLYKDTWQGMNMDRYIANAISNSAVVREGYIHVIYNAKKHKLEAYNLEPACINIDPNARSLKDASYVVITDRITVKEAMIKYPLLQNYKDEIANGEDTSPDGRGEIYAENDYNLSQENIRTKYTFYIKNPANDTIDIVEMVSRYIVSERTLPFSSFPISQMRWKVAAQSAYGLGLMDDVIKLQKGVNALESAIVNTGIMYAYPQMAVSKNSGLNPKAVAKVLGVPNIVYAINGSVRDAIGPVLPPAIDDRIVNMKDSLINTMLVISGNTKPFVGSLGSAGNTKGGAEASIERATIIEAKILANISDFVEDTTLIILDFLKYLYNGMTVPLRTKVEGTGDNRKFIFDNVEIPENIQDAQYMYSIDLNRKSKYSSEREKEKLLELYQIEAQYQTPEKLITPLDVLKTCGIKDEEVYVARYNKQQKLKSQQVADMIQSLVIMSTNAGIDPNFVNEAISELVGGGEETPTLDELLNVLGQNQQQKQAIVNEMSADQDFIANNELLQQEMGNASLQNSNDMV